MNPISPSGSCGPCGAGGSNGVSLSDDLLTQILTRLPLKSLFRFNCVSKAWYGLISDNYLRSKLPLITSGVYYSYNSNLTREPRYAHTSENGLEDCNLDFFPFHHNSSIIDSCNGLLLYYSCFPSKFYVVNPTAKRWVALPEPIRSSQLSILTFDPCHSPNYKVICFTSWLEQGSEIEVFSSETGRWVEHELHWGLSTDTMSATMQYFDGILYIIAYPKHIVAINLAEMDCHLIELPEPMKREGSVGKSRGSLHYTHNDGEQIRIWKLKDFNLHKWVLKHRIDVRATVERNYKRIHSNDSLAALSDQFNFLAFHPEKEVVYLSLPGKLVSYDLSKKRIEEVCEFGKERERAHLIQIWLFPFSRYMSDCLANA
ncbi:F-box protein At5g07610-like [Phoenix dactylifera]|uniref:F-box protein At5g07610-like n=1 Tax=Phoenix dactylifera TaxID=42345 RepID=A0A8B8ZVC9_PHODC|nr:F-box protein At5g07610-like [Phoenix dactylifera]